MKHRSFKTLIAAATFSAAAIVSASASSVGMTQAVFDRSNKILGDISVIEATNPALSEAEVLELNRLQGLATIGAREPRPSDAYPYATPNGGARER